MSKGGTVVVASVFPHSVFLDAHTPFLDMGVAELLAFPWHFLGTRSPLWPLSHFPAWHPSPHYASQTPPHQPLAVRNIVRRGEELGARRRIWARLIQGPGTDYRARGYCSCNLCHPLHQHRQVNEITGNASDTSTGVQDGAELGQPADPQKPGTQDGYNDSRWCGGDTSWYYEARSRQHHLTHPHLHQKKLASGIMTAIVQI
ncbi:hypothetical protein Pmani_015191 [Petrolisthes manimaculis]|uniref:Uncharacterized protein n=1 Tax=Petrolisthes manimaculis TaxID=1843537 RepID=A0AAE1PUY4_9EUCA|nr:hypothetical protein Pmani_015191 [Petrolisthes manimaculis]